MQIRGHAGIKYFVTHLLEAGAAVVEVGPNESRQAAVVRRHAGHHIVIVVRRAGLEAAVAVVTRLLNYDSVICLDRTDTMQRKCPRGPQQLAVDLVLLWHDSNS